MDKNVFYIMDEKYDGFSKTFKIISDYIRVNYPIISFLSIQELSEKIGVSAASITRFSQEIGFSGFPAFQKEIQKVLQNEITPMREIKNSISESSNDEDLLKKTIDLNIQNLKNTYSDNLNDSFKKAVEMIGGARKVYIIGLRSSFSVAYYLHFMLSQFMDNIVLLSAGTQDIFDRLSYVHSDDILVAISFTKYTKLTSQVANYFKKKNCGIIAVTDSQSAPVAIKSDSLLIAKNSSSTYSFVSAMTILNALIIGVGKKDKERTLNMLKEKERISIENDIYI